MLATLLIFIRSGIIANFCYSRNAASPKHLQCLTGKADKKLRLQRRGRAVVNDPLCIVFYVEYTIYGIICADHYSDLIRSRAPAKLFPIMQ